MNLLIIIIIASLSAYSSFISSSGPLTDRSGVRNTKRLTKNGKWVVAINFVLVTILAIQSYLNDLEIKEKDILAEKKQGLRDIMLKNNYDSSLRVSKKQSDSSLLVMKERFDFADSSKTRTVVEALGKYSLKLDTTNKNIAIVKDSAKTRIITPNDPIITLCDNIGIVPKSLNKKNHIYEISFCSETANSSSLELMNRIVVEDSTNILRIIGKIPILDVDNLIMGKGVTADLQIDGSKPYDIMYFTIEGDYKNFDKSKSYSISEIYFYDKKKKRFGYLKNRFKNDILKFLNSRYVPKLSSARLGFE
ncbi:hypothetical protein [Larkinella sp. C7]|uniref:hypothetical protein n=1 Tax=Larkinella sp. C7 TaxID=2576607 RepID=UPI0011112DDF|nr:hypothetical protein [Larkinella sp. C7]